MEVKKQFRALIEAGKGDIEQEHPATSAQMWVQAADAMSKDVVVISPEETVVATAKRMAEEDISSIIVMDGGKVVGILTETDLVRMTATEDKYPDRVKVRQIMSSPVEVISPDLSAFEAGIIMETKHVKRLPILANEQLVGVVTQIDLIRALTSYGMWTNVAEIMSKDVVGIQRTDSVAKAAKIMASRKIACIVVQEGDEVVGVFTEADLLKRVVAIQKEPAETRMEEVMSSSVMSVPVDYSIINARKTMENTNIRKLVVMDGKKLCGIVTQTDIFMAIRNKVKEEEAKNLSLLKKSRSNIYTTDLEGKITYVNPAFMKLLEVSNSAQLMGQPFLPHRYWVNPKDRSIFLEELKNGGIETKELALKSSKGKTIHVMSFSTLTKNVNGEIDGIQGILHDITERKLTEENLKEEITKRKEAEAKLKAQHGTFRLNPRIVKGWYKTEDAYRNAAKAWQQGKTFPSIRK